MTSNPDSTPTETSSPNVVPTAPPEDSALPGMKRGIAIGVACSVGIIMVALLAFFAYRRRKQQAAKAKHTKLSPEEPVEMDAGAFWPQEKTRHVQATPIEADAHTIHELDGSQVPEFPGHYEGQMLANKKTPRASYHAGDDNGFGVKLEHWNDWSVAPNSQQQWPVQEPPQTSNPYLEVSPSQPHATAVSPVGAPMPYTPPTNTSYHYAYSPALSPLEDAHITPSHASQTRQQHYYDQARASK